MGRASMNDNLRGILAVMIGSTAFVGHDATVKLVSAELPSGEIIILRGLIATAMMTVGVYALGATRPLSILATPLMQVRLLASAGGTVFIVMALRYLPLPTTTTVLQATPLAVIAGAALLYGDAVGWRRWLAVLTGFLGVVLIVRPGGDFGAATYLILLALICTTARDLSTRGLPKDIPSIFVAAAAVAVSTLSGLAVVPFDGAWQAPTPGAWAAMTASAAFLFVATTAMTTGVRTGEIAVVAPFRYATVPLALLLGWLLWGDAPDALAWAGIALVVAAGLYTLHRERSSLRKAPPAPAAQRSPAE
jgi:drug/metabolite transporter (DMT)-like permease